MSTSGNVAVARAVAGRQLRHAFFNPALAIPSVIFPVVFLIAFAGGLQKVGDVPGFAFSSGYTAFQFCFVFLQSSAFAGLFTGGFAVAADWESGFARRILLGAPHRTGLLLGYAWAGLLRWLATTVLITIGALLAGMNVNGSAEQIVGLVMLGVLVNVAATLWGIGFAMRTQSLQAGPGMQVPVFVLLFLAPVYVPLDLLTGWIHAVASWNPLTAILDSSRGFIDGNPVNTWVAFASAAGLLAVLAFWAVTGLRKAERGE